MEDPHHHMLKHWLENLKQESSNEQTSAAIAEIEAIRKQMVLENNKETPSSLPSIPCESIVPSNVTDYLFVYLFIRKFKKTNNK